MNGFPSTKNLVPSKYSQINTDRFVNFAPKELAT